MQKLTYLLGSLYVCALLLTAAPVKAQGSESNIIVLADTVNRFSIMLCLGSHCSTPHKPRHQHLKQINSLLKTRTHLPCQNFTQVINADRKYALVFFYVPDSAAEFASAVTQIEAFGPNPPVLFAQVDFGQNRQLASRFNVNSTTLMWFVGGQPQPYAGLSLMSDDIVFWVISAIDTITTTLNEQVRIP